MKSYILILMVLLIALSSACNAYDNDGRDQKGNGLMKGGPHRTINELAQKHFIDKMQKNNDPILRNYDFEKGKTLLGSTVIKPGLEFVTEGDVNKGVSWWIIEGGYTADEPELYNSFRHFYDPFSRNGAPYLTDHLDELDWAYRNIIFAMPSIAGAVTKTVLGEDFNPQINAKDWAITGDKGNSFWENEYCWKKGIQYMQQAFSSTSKDKRRLFAKSWRSLGETMHLLADMTCVPHVRNDSHPGKGLNWDRDADKGLLKNDPYELFCTEDVVRKYGGYAVDPKVGLKIFAAKTPDELFHQVALYTNSNFFSADTINGMYTKGKGEPNLTVNVVIPANGCASYMFPVLSEMRLDEKTGYFYSNLNGREICMIHENWTSAVGWAEDTKNTGYTIPRKCCLDQASILIPAAVHANSKLAEMFIPRVQVKVDELDMKEKLLKGSIKHIPSGAFSKEMIYNSGPDQYAKLYVNGKPLTFDKLVIKNGKFEIDLSPVQSLSSTSRFAIEVDIAGILVKSESEGNVSVTVLLKENEVPEEEKNAGNPFAGLSGIPVPGTDVTLVYTTADKKQTTLTGKTDKQGHVAFKVPLDVTVTVTARGETKSGKLTSANSELPVVFGWQGRKIILGK